MTAATPTATNADEQRGPRAHDDLAEDVAAELVGAEPVLRRGRQQPAAASTSVGSYGVQTNDTSAITTRSAHEHAADDEAGAEPAAGPRRAGGRLGSSRAGLGARSSLPSRSRGSMAT